MQKRVLELQRSDSRSDQEESIRLSSEMLPGLLERADELRDEMQASGKLRRRSSLTIYGLEGLLPGATISEELYTYNWLCWFKYNKTYADLMQEYRGGDFKAAKQLHQLNLEFDKWRFGKTDPNKLKFKTDVDHFALIIAGSDLGIDSLTPEELAECFDELCPCGRPHFPENLSKLRRRIQKRFPFPPEEKMVKR